MKNTPEQIEGAIIELIEFEVKMLKSMNIFKQLELLNATNTKTYEKECGNALLYSIKEDRILNSIDCLPSEFEEGIKGIIFNLDLYLEDMNELQKQDIEARLTRIFGNKCKELTQKHDNGEEYEDGEIEVINFSADIYGQDDKYESINEQIEMQRLIFLQQFIDNTNDDKIKEEATEEKFRLIYENKKITDNLLQSNMNPYFLFETPDDVIAKSLEMKDETFKAQKKEQLHDYISDSIDFLDTEEIKDINNINQIIKSDCDLAFIYYLLSTLPTNELSEYLIEYQSEYNDDKQPQYNLMINMLNDILKDRKDYKKLSSELLECKSCFAISDELFEQFSSLIKLSELIVEKFKILCEIEKQNLKHSDEYIKSKKELESYLEFEQEILNDLDFSLDESETLTDILDAHLPILLQHKHNASIVKKRIGSMVPDLIDDFSAVAYDENVSYTIHQTLILNTLQKFEEKIDKEQNKEIKDKLIEEKYLQCCYNRCINLDMVHVDFEPSKITILDDTTIAELLDIHDFEYGFDKNVELYVLANALIHEVVHSKHKNIGYILYRQVCLEEILKNLNDENILDLEEQYNTQITQSKKQQNIENNFKIKKIFKKVKPKYLN